MPGSSFLYPILALVVAGGVALYFYNPSTSTTLVSVFGLLRNLGLMYAALVLLFLGPNNAVYLLAGGLLFALAIYFGRGHWDRLEGNSLRSRLNG